MFSKQLKVGLEAGAGAAAVIDFGRAADPGSTGPDRARIITCSEWVPGGGSTQMSREGAGAQHTTFRSLLFLHKPSCVCIPVNRIFPRSSCKKKSVENGLILCNL